MFSGIIEEVATVVEAVDRGSNRELWIRAACASELRPDQSVAHNGVCLTVEEVRADLFRVTVIAESLSKSNLGSLTAGSRVNLERCLRADQRVDGHFVQGHVDTTGTVLSVVDLDGSRDLWVQYDRDSSTLIVPRGSIAVDGISLTVAELDDARSALKVSLIPYTLEHTNVAQRKVGDLVNLEFDVLGKYARRFLELRGNQTDR